MTTPPNADLALAGKLLRESFSILVDEIELPRGAAAFLSASALGCAHVMRAPPALAADGVGNPVTIRELRDAFVAELDGHLARLGDLP